MENREKKNQIVFIGQDLDHDKIREQVEACFVNTTRGKGFD
jgi:hypothetical protein